MWWLAILGFAVLLGGLVDLIWTTLGTHGGGPLSAPLTKIFWKGAVALHRKSPHHRLLSFCGSVLLFWLMTFWIFLGWLGWVLVFSSHPGSLINAKSKVPVDQWTRIYFVGSTMFTAESSEYVPNGVPAQMGAALTAGTGLIIVTIAITYFIGVLNAAVAKRTVATFVWDMGATPERIVDRAWNGSSFEGIDQQLVDLTGALEIYAENHLAYPILHFFHAETRRTSAPLRVAALHETMLLMQHGCHEDVRPPKIILEGVLDSIRGFTDVIAEEFVTPAEEAPPPPDRSILTSRGIPVCPAEEFTKAVDAAREVRRRLLCAIEEAGWTWQEIDNSNSRP